MSEKQSRAPSTQSVLSALLYEVDERLKSKSDVSKLAQQPFRSLNSFLHLKGKKKMLFLMLLISFKGNISFGGRYLKKKTSSIVMLRQMASN